MKRAKRWSDGHPVLLVENPNYFAKVHCRLQARLPIWVIYRPITREFPGSWVARMHVCLPVSKPTRFVITHDSLEQLRSLLPPGLTNLTRDPGDLPEIEEVWF